MRRKGDARNAAKGQGAGAVAGMASVAKSGARGPASKCAWLWRRLFGRRFVHLGDVVPVDEILEERLEVIGAPVAIVDIIRMLPDVAAEDRSSAVDQRILAVRRLRDGELAVLDREPAPAGAELGDAGLNEIFLELCDRADVGGDLLFQLAGNLVAAAALLHPLPEMNVVVVLSGIVEQAGILAEGAFDDLLDRLVFPLRAFGEVIA